MRQYGRAVPWLDTVATPAIVSATGLGTGGGAGVFSKDITGGSFGEIRITNGPGASAVQTIILAFAAAPTTYFFAARNGATVAQATAGNQITLTITNPAAPQPGRTDIDYEYSVVPNAVPTSVLGQPLNNPILPEFE